MARAVLSTLNDAIKCIVTDCDRNNGEDDRDERLPTTTPRQRRLLAAARAAKSAHQRSIREVPAPLHRAGVLHRRLHGGASAGRTRRPARAAKSAHQRSIREVPAPLHRAGVLHRRLHGVQKTRDGGASAARTRRHHFETGAGRPLTADAAVAQSCLLGKTHKLNAHRTARRGRSVASRKIVAGTKGFDCKRATVLCLGHRLFKHKRTIG